MKIQKEMTLACRCTALIAALLICSSLARAENLEIIPLQHRPADLMLAPLRAVAASETKITASSGQLIIRGSEQEVAQLRLLIEELDQPLTQFKITVRQNNKKTNRARDLQLAAQHQYRSQSSTGSLKVGKTTLDGKPLPPNSSSATLRHSNSTMTSRVKSYSTSAHSHSEQQLSALEGYSSYIETGEEIPFLSVDIDYGTIDQAYKPVITGFYVTPILSGAERVTLQISAQKQSLQKHSPQHIETANYHSTINVRLGDWVDLGATLERSRGTETSIGKQYKVRSHDGYQLEVMVERSR